MRSRRRDAAVLGLLALTLTSCASTPTSSGSASTSVTSSATPSSAAPSTTAASPSSASAPASSASAPRTSASAPHTSATSSVTSVTPTSTPSCQTLAASLTRAEQVGQLYMMGVEGSSIGPQESAHLHNLRIGSVVLLQTPVMSQSAVRALTESIVRAGGGRVPVLVSADQEGGLVQRLKGSGFSTIPAATEQATWSTSALSSAWATYGAQLHGAGVRYNLAPVTDLVTPEYVSTNAPIGQLHRNYGTTTTSVARSVGAVIDGLDRAGVAASAKHFPGLGAVTTNTDFGVATDYTTTTSSPSLDGFRAAIRAGAASVMVSSAIYEKIDPGVAAVFSSRIVTGLLRQQLGYTGVAISDDLGNAKSVAAVPAAERGTRFLLAGGDIAMDADPATIEAMVDNTLARAASDHAFAASITAKVARVLALKARVGLVSCTD